VLPPKKNAILVLPWGGSPLANHHHDGDPALFLAGFL
jgi:hypothetical protein